MKARKTRMIMKVGVKKTRRKESKKRFRKRKWDVNK